MFFVSCATVFHTIWRCSDFSSFFVKMAVFFVFLRNIHFSIEILKIKIPEYSYPPSQYFFVNKAFIRFFSCRRKVALCHLAEWHIACWLAGLSCKPTPFKSKRKSFNQDIDIGGQKICFILSHILNVQINERI